MTTFAILSTIISLIVFAGFVVLSVKKFGWLHSYSAFAAKWNEAVPINNAHLWSIVTIFSAFFLIPAMLEAGDESPLQFLGFAAPVYLAVVGLTPEWETKNKQKIIHLIGTGICAAAALMWLILALRLWYLIPISLLIVGCAAYFTHTIKISYIFWLEMVMFLAVYTAVLLPF